MKRAWKIPMAILFLGAVIMLIVSISQSCLLFEQEYARLLGAAEQSASSVEAVWAAMNAGNASLVQSGYEILGRAGYAASARRVWAGRMLRSVGPLWLTALLFAAGATGLWIAGSRRASAAQQALEKDNSRLRQENQALHERIQTQMETMDLYEGNLYHQLKTPLTGIRLALEQIREQESAEKARLCQSALEQTGHMDQCLRLLLREKQLSAVQEKLSYRPAVLNDMVTGAISQLAEQTRAARRRILFTADTEECLLPCDEFWMTECISALLENALTHSSPGEDIRVRLTEQSGRCVLRVASPGTLPSAVEPGKLFTRYQSTSTGHFGIGLPMARQVARLHHGTLTLEQDTANVSFVLTLPILTDERAYAVMKM